MNINNATINLGYLSLALVLSFFIIYNIYIVWLGISLALYTLNMNSINTLVKNIIHSKKDEEELVINKLNKTTKEGSENKETVISLVETIEKSGYIPSIEKNDSTNAA